MRAKFVAAVATTMELQNSQWSIFGASVSNLVLRSVPRF